MNLIWNRKDRIFMTHLYLFGCKKKINCLYKQLSGGYSSTEGLKGGVFIEFKNLKYWGVSCLMIVLNQLLFYDFFQDMTFICLNINEV